MLEPWLSKYRFVTKVSLVSVSLRDELNPGARFSNVPETFRARKAISKTMKTFIYRAFNVNRFCILAKLTLIQRFESKNLSGFSATDF